MTAIGLERALGMLLLDAVFCERFFLDPKSAVWEAVRFRESLGPRLRRSAP